MPNETDDYQLLHIPSSGKVMPWNVNVDIECFIESMQLDTGAHYLLWLRHSGNTGHKEAFHHHKLRSYSGLGAVNVNVTYNLIRCF